LQVVLLMFALRCSAQNEQINTKVIPFYDAESQSNVVVSVWAFFDGVPCPASYTNLLTNTNLFTEYEQKQAAEIFVKYRNVTTNSGPSGTKLVGITYTNVVTPFTSFTNRFLEAVFQYTNSSARERIMFMAHGIWAIFTSNHGDGYEAALGEESGRFQVGFWQTKHNVADGLTPVLFCFVFRPARGVKPFSIHGSLPSPGPDLAGKP
jgi:hypothetical protein